MREKLTTYIEEENLKELNIRATERNCSVADILNELVENYLKSNEELELTKMLFVYEQTVGGFESEYVLDLINYYYEAVNENGFDHWLKEIDLENEWLNYRRERGVAESLDEFFG